MKLLDLVGRSFLHAALNLSPARGDETEDDITGKHEPSRLTGN